MKNRILIYTLLLFCFTTNAQKITIKDTIYTTYSFSDPNNIPIVGNIYPYYKFENFSLKPEEKNWKLIILENEWLRVRIMPEIGGKVWSVYDKVNGKELFYDNDVIKFREISLRGPWTSGGIEFNYGIIGHAPSCAHPVEWTTEYKEDGSVSCYIGVLELLTRTKWTIEINLPKDAAFLKTRSFWHNGSGEYQPYYTWANSAVKASDDLEIIYPGTYTIEHDGNTSSYPIDEKGRNLSLYSNQDFGVDKSYHPGGTHKGFFGAYWRNEDFGMIHYALRDEKLGRKYFSWAQSAQGDIWKDILTDKSPQYVELQSGRLLNQNLLNSVRTPYKQTLFSPFSTDIWNEYWIPFSGIGLADEVNLDAVVSIRNNTISIFPLKTFSGELIVEDKNKNILLKENVTFNIATPYKFQLENNDIYSIKLGEKKIWINDNKNLSRPNLINKDFSLNSADGLTKYAEYLYGMRYYKDAEAKVDSALILAPSLSAALNLKAQICLRKNDNKGTIEYTDKVLAINQYDPIANYIRGLAFKSLELYYDALDSFEVAAISSELRSPSLLQIAYIYFLKEDYTLSKEYARKSLINNQYNISAYELLYQIENNPEILEEILSLDPLNHLSNIEKMLVGDITKEELAKSIKEEMRWQVYMEYIAYYKNLGLFNKAIKLIEGCPEKNVLLQIWYAWLKNDVGLLQKLSDYNINLVFPFRKESLEPLQWAVENTNQWQSNYLLAILEDFLGHDDISLDLLSAYESDYAPYYAYRASLNQSYGDYLKAVELDPKEWRYRQNLALRFYQDAEYFQALNVIESYYYSNSENFHIGDTYVKLLIATKQYEKANNVISKMKILPFEGQTGSHILWRDIKLHLAAKAIDKKDLKEAKKRIKESREWPKNLGVGKPYDYLIDENIEDVLSAIVAFHQGNYTIASNYIENIKDKNLIKLYKEATTKYNGKYPKVEVLLGNLDASLDKKIF